jgi:hypothetical protein
MRRAGDLLNARHDLGEVTPAGDEASGKFQRLCFLLAQFLEVVPAVLSSLFFRGGASELGSANIEILLFKSQRLQNALHQPEAWRERGLFHHPLLSFKLPFHNQKVLRLKSIIQTCIKPFILSRSHLIFFRFFGLCKYHLIIFPSQYIPTSRI